MSDLTRWSFQFNGFLLILTQMRLAETHLLLKFCGMPKPPMSLYESSNSTASALTCVSGTDVCSSMQKCFVR